MADASIDPSAFKRQPYPFPSASGLWKFDKAINNYPRAHRELRRNFWVTPTVSCRLPTLRFPPSSTSFRILPIHPFLPFTLSPFPRFLSFLPFVRPALLYYFIRFFFSDLTVKLSNPSTAIPLDRTESETEGTRTVELVAPYVPCRRRRYSLSYPYRTPSLRALRPDIELRDRELEPGRVDFRFPTEGNDPDSRARDWYPAAVIRCTFRMMTVHSGFFGNVWRLGGSGIVSFWRQKKCKFSGNFLGVFHFCFCFKYV